MPQPNNYMIPVADPTQNFLQGFQVVQAMQQQQAAQQQAKQRQEVLTRMRALGTSATADDIVQASLALPEDAALFKQTWDLIDGAKKGAIFNAGAEAYQLSGQPTEAAQRLETYAEAARNSGDDELAKQLSDTATLVKADPDAARDTIGLMLAFADPDKFKTIAASTQTGPQLDTTIIKNLIAEGLEPGTPKFQEALKNERTKTSIFIPDRGFISGTPEFIQSVLGGPPPQDAVTLPRPVSKEDFDRLQPGTEYIDPQGNRRRKSGGAGGNASGGFQPSQ